MAYLPNNGVMDARVVVGDFIALVGGAGVQSPTLSGRGPRLNIDRAT